MPFQNCGEIGTGNGHPDGSAATADLEIDAARRVADHIELVEIQADHFLHIALRVAFALSIDDRGRKFAAAGIGLIQEDALRELAHGDDLEAIVRFRFGRRNPTPDQIVISKQVPIVKDDGAGYLDDADISIGINGRRCRDLGLPGRINDGYPVHLGKLSAAARNKTTDYKQTQQKHPAPHYRNIHRTLVSCNDLIVLDPVRECVPSTRYPITSEGCGWLCCRILPSKQPFPSRRDAGDGSGQP